MILKEIRYIKEYPYKDRIVGTFISPRSGTYIIGYRDNTKKELYLKKGDILEIAPEDEVVSICSD